MATNDMAILWVNHSLRKLKDFAVLAWALTIHIHVKDKSAQRATVNEVEDTIRRIFSKNPPARYILAQLNFKVVGNKGRQTGGHTNWLAFCTDEHDRRVFRFEPNGWDKANNPENKYFPIQKVLKEAIHAAGGKSLEKWGSPSPLRANMNDDLAKCNVLSAYMAVKWAQQPDNALELFSVLFSAPKEIRDAYALMVANRIQTKTPKPHTLPKIGRGSKTLVLPKGK